MEAGPEHIAELAAEIRKFFGAAGTAHIIENDRIWGKGNWAICLMSECVVSDKLVFHHKDFHDGPPEVVAVDRQMK